MKKESANQDYFSGMAARATDAHLDKGYDSSKSRERSAKEGARVNQLVDASVRGDYKRAKHLARRIATDKSQRDDYYDKLSNGFDAAGGDLSGKYSSDKYTNYAFNAFHGKPSTLTKAGERIYQDSIGKTVKEDSIMNTATQKVARLYGLYRNGAEIPQEYADFFKKHLNMGAGDEYNTNVLWTLRREIYEKDLKKKDLTSRLSAKTAIVGLVSGAFFFSTSVTGNVIGLSNGTSSIIGAVLLVIGFVAGYFWARGKRHTRVSRSQPKAEALRVRKK